MLLRCRNPVSEPRRGLLGLGTPGYSSSDFVTLKLQRHVPTSITPMPDRALLATVELFDDLEPDQIDQIADASASRLLSRGDVLFTEGDEPNDLFVVVSGRIAMANKSIAGRESVLALMERGGLFGEIPLSDGLARSAEARALEPSEVIAIPYTPLRTLYQTQPSLL